MKAYEEKQTRIYYKLSNYDEYRGIFGHECVNELIVSRVMDCLGIPHLSYRLIHARVCIEREEIETWVCASEDFRKKEEEKIGFDLFYELEKVGEESPLEFAVRNGWERDIYRMFLIDYLAANRDRHGSNLEVIQNQKGELRLAPLFDQGVSLLFSTYGDELQIEKADVMRDFPANNYIGARSLMDNLTLIPKEFDLQIRPLREADRTYIFRGLNGILSEKHMDKIWEMIWKRWKRYEEICN